MLVLVWLELLSMAASRVALARSRSVMDCNTLALIWKIWLYVLLNCPGPLLVGAVCGGKPNVCCGWLGFGLNGGNPDVCCG